MPIHNMKAFAFEAPSYDEWKEAAVQSLKGKSFESLLTKTAEGIDLLPLYTKEDIDQQQISRVTKPQFGWTIAQPAAAENGEQFLLQLTESLERGNQAITYNGLKAMVWTEEELRQLAQLLTKHPVLLMDIEKDDPIMQAFTFVEESDRAAVKGIVISDTAVLPGKFPNIRTKGADLWTVHHEGADAVTELALSLAIAAEKAEEAGSFEEFTEGFYARFASDTHFFMEIAKFRSFRVLWKLFNDAYGVANAKQVPLVAITSLRSYSKLDPYVNLLRGGNAAFAAVLGGADWLTVLPHDVLTGTSPGSNRYARNIQLILKEETHIDQVLDPAGGSYFIETLTAELVRKSWDKFLTIEEMGGYQSYLQSGELSRQFAQRQKEAAVGKKTMIGTNVYAELTDINLAESPEIAVTKRLAEPFENLRARQQESLPKTVLINFGALKDYKPRADFVSGFLAVGGIEAQWSPSFESIDQALGWISEQQPDYAVLCASAAQSEEVIAEFLNMQKTNCVIDAAGKYDQDVEDQWLAAGLHGFIFAGQDKIDKLNEIAHIKKGGLPGE
ncbi:MULTISPECIES: methylmalonyl-CoA mutase family protein [unclassified Sporosarcina]|uniref:methylmalonyl-CoA mutase family protein n=1 Tax=unclassified Sporosarcina TaxID=2647733 RepID=UPI002040EF80|nr:MULTISPECIES: methylmalonyl-CoA mutase family protein [unclassified Sporosarcina]GKV64549.1 methylmalonyl-CoA mutase [Sporosarcina sp. NCCP-2331]GLB54578.1 methylmalonyl-CoA mutase [Sporosarcina sp. NCCP-2378]